METGSKILRVEEHRRDKSFDPRSGQRYQLSLVAGPGFLQSAILDVILNQYIGLSYYTFTEALSTAFEAFLEEEKEVMGGGFKRVQLSLAEPRYTLVPGALYQRDRSPEYLQLVHSGLENGFETRQDRLRNLDIQNIYAPDEAFEDAFEKVFRHPVIHHHITPLLDTAHLHFRNSEKPRVLVHLMHQQLDIISLNGRHLRFCNSYHCEGAEDVLYHLLAALEIIAPDRSTIDITVAGDAQETEVFQLLKEQLPEISRKIPEPVFKFAPELQGMNAARYYLLLNQYRVI